MHTQYTSAMIYRVGQIKWHHFTFEWHRKALFVTTKKHVKQVAVYKKVKCW